MLGGAIVALLIGIYFATGGGITQQVSQVMGLKEGAIATYDRNAATHQVYAEIKGVWAADRTRADGRYFILGTEGSEFIVMNGKGIYKTGVQIISEHLSTAIGSPATAQTLNLTFSDEEATAQLQPLVSSYPNATIYLSGSVAVDMPEEIKLVSLPNQFQTASLVGSTLNLTLHPSEQALLQLKEQYAIGTLTVRVIQPKPNFE